MRVPSSADSPLVEGAKLVVRELIDEPVKEAVHEAYAEEREVEEPTGSTPTTGTQVQEGGTSGKRRGRRITRLLVPIVGVAGAALLRRRLRNRKSGTDDLVGEPDETRTFSVSETDLPDAGSSHRNRSSADDSSGETGDSGGTEGESPFGGDEEESDAAEEADESDTSPPGPT